MCHHIWFEDILVWLRGFTLQPQVEVKKVGDTGSLRGDGMVTEVQGSEKKGDQIPPSRASCLRMGSLRGFMLTLNI